MLDQYNNYESSSFTMKISIVVVIKKRDLNQHTAYWAQLN